MGMWQRVVAERRWRHDLRWNTKVSYNERLFVNQPWDAELLTSNWRSRTHAFLHFYRGVNRATPSGYPLSSYPFSISTVSELIDYRKVKHWKGLVITCPWTKFNLLDTNRTPSLSQNALLKTWYLSLLGHTCRTAFVEDINGYLPFHQHSYTP